jgi:chromosome segregation ATPase
MTIDNIVSQVIIFGLGLLPIVLIYFRNLNKELQNRNEAQDIINKRFEKVSEDLDLTRAELTLIKVSFAEERGGLNQRIKSLEETLAEQRLQSEDRSRENYGQIATLQSQLSELRIVQGELQAEAKRVSMERDEILAKMRENVDELTRLQTQVADLTLRNNDLQRQLDDKDRQLALIKEKLDGTTTE